MFLCRIVVHILRLKIRVSSHIISCVAPHLRHHVHHPVHAAAAVELHRVVRDGAVLGPLQQRHLASVKVRLSSDLELQTIHWFAQSRIRLLGLLLVENTYKHFHI